MGIFTRMSNMVKGKVNAAMDELEDAIELLDQKIRDMDDQFNKAKLASAQVLGNVHAIEKQLEAAKKDSENYDQKVKIAMANGKEDLAKQALARRIEADKKVTTLTTQYETAKAKAEQLKSNLRALEEEIAKTRSYRDEAAARMANAEASQSVNEILADVKTKTNSIKIDDIERKIQKKEALADGLGDLRDIDNFESEFAKLDTLDLDLELEKYKTNTTK